MSPPHRRCLRVSCAAARADAERPPRPAATHRRRSRRRERHRGRCSRAAPTRGDHTSGAWVFPGGIVDARAIATRTRVLPASTTPRRAAARPGERRARLLRRRDPRVLRGVGPAVRRAVGSAADRRSTAATRRAWRRGAARCIAASTASPSSAPPKASAWLPIALVYLSHWLTPLGRAKRFDTRFFIAARAGRADRRVRRHRDGRAALDRARPRRSRAATR